VRKRREYLGYGQDLSKYGGPKRNMVGALETRGKWPMLPSTRARWSRALKWEPDAFDRLLRGKEPRELSNGLHPVEIDRYLERLERAVVELRRFVQSQI
jgi:hypothetical protein